MSGSDHQSQHPAEGNCGLVVWCSVVRHLENLIKQEPRPQIFFHVYNAVRLSGGGVLQYSRTVCNMSDSGSANAGFVFFCYKPALHTGYRT